MAIKKFSNKALSPENEMTRGRKNAIIETKEQKQKYCYPEHGVTVEATSQDEADEKVKKIIK